MNVTKAADGSLLLTYDGRLWSRWPFGGALLMAVIAVYDMTIGTRGDDRLIALIGGMATCPGVAAVMFESARFRIDPFQRIIEWDRRWAFQHRSGTLRFADVRHVAIEVPIGDEGIPSRRIVLHMIDGSMVPVTAGYRTDADNRIVDAAESVRSLLGHEPKPKADEVVRALLASGRKVDAIKVLVEEEMLSLSEAKGAARHAGCKAARPSSAAPRDQRDEIGRSHGLDRHARTRRHHGVGAHRKIRWLRPRVVAAPVTSAIDPRRNLAHNLHHQSCQEFRPGYAWPLLPWLGARQSRRARSRCPISPAPGESTTLAAAVRLTCGDKHARAW